MWANFWPDINILPTISQHIVNILPTTLPPPQFVNIFTKIFYTNDQWVSFLSLIYPPDNQYIIHKSTFCQCVQEQNLRNFKVGCCLSTFYQHFPHIALTWGHPFISVTKAISQSVFFISYSPPPQQLTLSCSSKMVMVTSPGGEWDTTYCLFLAV